MCYVFLMNINIKIAFVKDSIIVGAPIAFICASNCTGPTGEHQGATYWAAGTMQVIQLN